MGAAIHYHRCQPHRGAELRCFLRVGDVTAAEATPPPALPTPPPLPKRGEPGRERASITTMATRGDLPGIVRNFNEHHDRLLSEARVKHEAARMKTKARAEIARMARAAASEEVTNQTAQTSRPTMSDST